MTMRPLIAVAMLAASLAAHADNTLYLIKDTEVVAKHHAADVDYLTFSLPQGVTDNLPDPEAPPHEATLLLGGSSTVALVKTAGMKEGDPYTSNIISRWDARSFASTIGLSADKMDHIDECKPVTTPDGQRRILVTSSYGWTVMLDEELNPLFHTTGTTNAHSAELINGRWVVVACSSGGDELRIYDGNRSTLLKFRTDLPSAHGAVWMEEEQRLYAIGGQTLYVYTLDYRVRPSGEKDENYPMLVLEKTITTPQNGLHDLTRVDAHTLCVSGKRSRLFDTATGTFSEIPLFDRSTALKSVTYSKELNRVWYTDATVPEGDYSWSTHTVRFSDNPSGSADTFTFSVPDLNLYKVRVVSWTD